MIFGKNKPAEDMACTIYLMSEDLYEIARRVDPRITREDVVASYVKAAEGPSRVEKLLIEEGCIDNDFCHRNRLMEYVFREWEKMHPAKEPRKKKGDAEA